MSKTISILGATGSIGRQTLDVAEQLGLTVAALTANSNAERLEDQARRFRPRLAVLTDEAAAKDLAVRLADTDTKVLGGPEALTEAAQTGDFDYDFIDNDSEDLSRLEGFLFPDTYEFYVGHNAEDALDRLLRNFVSRMDEDRMAQVEESNYSLREIITIASLIEEETDGTDQANIASVIYNRLEGPGDKQGTYGLLQIDASLLYALPDHEGAITSADMQTDSPYNLYQHAGLPPTPISNPGLASIDAALNPNSTDYYYYALGTDGLHHFSTTLAEHNAFVNSSSYGG